VEELLRLSCAGGVASLTSQARQYDRTYYFVSVMGSRGLWVWAEPAAVLFILGCILRCIQRHCKAR
jgi:hypothetical protein